MMTNKVKETLMVFYQNINGLGKKKDCLKDYSTKSSHDIYILTETKHRPGKIKVFKEKCFPENFDILRTAGFTKKSGNAQGGVLIAAAKTFNLKLNKELNGKFNTKLGELECLCATIKHDGFKTVNIIAVYAHPVCPAPRFQNFFVELSKIKNERQYENFIIAGDFNYDDFYKYKVSNSSAISIQLSKIIEFENSTGIKMQCEKESLNDNGNMLDMIFCNRDISIRNEPTVLQKSPKQHKSLIFNFKMERSSQEELLKLSMEKIISSFDIALKELEKCVKFSSAIDTRQMSDPIGPYVTEKLATINEYGTKMETLKSAIRIGTQTNNNHSKSKRQDFDFPSSGSEILTNHQRKRKISGEGNNLNAKKELIFTEGSMEHFEFNLHRGNYAEGVVITCKICKQLTGSIDELRHHIRENHSNIKWNSWCSICHMFEILNTDDSVEQSVEDEFEHLITHMNQYIMKPEKQKKISQDLPNEHISTESTDISVSERKEKLNEIEIGNENGKLVTKSIEINFSSPQDIKKQTGVEF